MSQRPINELIWHCTATPEGRETTVAEIDRWHKARGWSGIGYHKVVHLDGSVSEGRPESQVGAHVANRNTGTIGYVYVGGTEKGNVKKAKDTRTPAQKRTMERLTIEAVAKYRLKKISGHSDYANKACPCFNASAEYSHLLAGGVSRPEPIVPKKQVPEVAPMDDAEAEAIRKDEARPQQPDDPGPEAVEPRPGLFTRTWKWMTGGVSAAALSVFGYNMPEWQAVIVVCVALFLMVWSFIAFFLYLFGKERIRNWISKQVG
jgi:hypothetical protein